MISQRVIKRFCMVRALREKSLNPFNCRWTIGKSEKSYEISHSHAFTLIELLIVIAIIAILGSATVLVLNPVEIIKQGRDGTRITDVENIQKSLNLTLFNNPSLVDSLLSTNIYLSLPSGSCPLSPPTGYAYVCNATSANINKTDGTGWIPLTLQNMASLPTDPNSNFYYAFIANPTTKTFTVTALLESEKQTKLSAAKDGGTDPGRFEKGDTGLWSGASGLVGYWPMDEGTGTTTADLSENARIGTLTGDPAWITSSNCKSGNCISFDGVDDKISLISQIALDKTNSSMSWWMKRSAPTRYECIFSRVNGGSNGHIEVNSSGRIRYESTTNNVSSGTFSTESLTYDGSWHHYTIVFGTSNIIVYADGRLISQISASADTVDFLIQHFGNQQSQVTYIYGNWLTGLLDEISFYNKALSMDEVQAIYNAYK